METLNCRIGDLAILTHGVVPKNSESYVRVVGSYGYIEWPGFPEKIFVWKVELNSDGHMFYEKEDGVIELLKEGPAPDAFLLPIPDPASEAIKGCLAQHPNLSREDAFQMARDFGFI
jgi:hypothetical protein